MILAFSKNAERGFSIFTFTFATSIRWCWVFQQFAFDIMTWMIHENFKDNKKTERDNFELCNHYSKGIIFLLFIAHISAKWINLIMFIKCVSVRQNSFYTASRSVNHFFLKQYLPSSNLNDKPLAKLTASLKFKTLLKLGNYSEVYPVSVRRQPSSVNKNKSKQWKVKAWNAWNERERESFDDVSFYKRYSLGRE